MHRFRLIFRSTTSLPESLENSHAWTSCPDFSVAGKQAGASGRHGVLSQVYMDAICLFKPDFFVFENVKGLLKTAKHRA